MTFQATTTTALCILLFSITAHSYTAPYTEPKFRPALDRSKLQEEDDDGDRKVLPAELQTYASRFFRLLNSGNIQFRMNGAGNRCELREMTSSGNEAAWDISSSNTMYATVAVPSQASAIDEVTFLQVHCVSKPMLRVSWMRSYSGQGISCTDCIIAHVRDGLGSSDVNKFELTGRHSTYKQYRVRVKSSKLSIWIDGSRKLNEEDVSFWASPNVCNFKAGAYVIHETDDSVEAKVKFSELDWS